MTILRNIYPFCYSTRRKNSKGGPKDDYIDYIAEFDEIAYSMNIVSLFLVTYGAYCVFMEEYYGKRIYSNC